MIALEVTFKLIYRDIPLFWQVGAFIGRYGYNLYCLYDCTDAPGNNRVHGPTRCSSAPYQRLP